MLEGINGLNPANGNQNVKYSAIQNLKEDKTLIGNVLNGSKSEKPIAGIETISGNSFDFSNNETDISDKNGHLKKGVPLESVLNEDGTLKDGWSLVNGVPVFSKKAKMEKMADRSFHDSGCEYKPEPKPETIVMPDGTIMHLFPAEPAHMPCVGENEVPKEPKKQYEPVPKYEVKDGKLVENGFTFVESHIVLQ